MQKTNRVSKGLNFSVGINRKEKIVNILINKKKVDLNFVEFIALNERVQEGLTQINIGRWNKPFICVYHRSYNFSIDITQYEELANEMNSIAGLVTILNESDGPFYENNNYANGLRTLSINWFHPR